MMCFLKSWKKANETQKLESEPQVFKFIFVFIYYYFCEPQIKKYIYIQGHLRQTRAH
jgi:hypothetical protein